MLQWAPLVAPVPAEEGAQLQDFNNPETAELGGECDIVSLPEFSLLEPLEYWRLQTTSYQLCNNLDS